MAAIRHRVAANGPDCAKMRLTFHCFFHLSSCFQTENLLWPDCQSRFFYRLRGAAERPRPCFFFSLGSEHSVPQVQDAPGGGGYGEVVGDLEDGVPLTVQLAEQPQDLPAGGGV